MGRRTRNVRPGMVQALWRAASDALDPGPLQIALREARRGMEDQLTRIGPPASSGFLEGTSGIMLAQNDLPLTGSDPPAWDSPRSSLRAERQEYSIWPFSRKLHQARRRKYSRCLPVRSTARILIEAEGHLAAKKDRSDFR